VSFVPWQFILRIQAWPSFADNQLKEDKFMPSAFGIALSALKGFSTKLDVTANNVANLETNDFKRSHVELHEAANGGVKVNISSVDTPGLAMDPNVRTGRAQQESNVNLEEEIANQIIAQYSYEASILTLKTAAEMQKELLDIKA
jgi:flagellar hook protein FlgE